MWRVTPPGYVHEYGDSSAMRTRQLYPPQASVADSRGERLR